MNKQKGFTLIELMITIGLIALLLSYGAPKVVSSIKTSILNENTKKIGRIVEQTRLYAMTQNTSVCLKIDTNTKSVTVSDMNTGAEITKLRDTLSEKLALTYSAMYINASWTKMCSVAFNSLGQFPITSNTGLDAPYVRYDIFWENTYSTYNSTVYINSNGFSNETLGPKGI